MDRDFPRHALRTEYRDWKLVGNSSKLTLDLPSSCPLNSAGLHQSKERPLVKWDKHIHQVHPVQVQACFLHFV